MGILTFIKSFIGNEDKSKQNNRNAVTVLESIPNSKTIGELGAYCPYCRKKLEKKPSRKKKCPHCENYIYSRTRPFDREKILITESQIDQIEEQWAVINGQHDLYLKEKERKNRIRSQLKVSSGTEPTDDIIEWSVLNEQSKEYAEQCDWGFYRNKRLEMAKHLQKQLKLLESLKMYLEVCYIDSNGPQNTSGWSEQMKKKWLQFSPDNAMIYTGIVKRIDKLVKKLDLNLKNIEAIYLKTASDLGDNLSGIELPVTPESAWEDLKIAIEEFNLQNRK